MFLFFSCVGFSQVPTSTSSYRISHTSTQRIFQSKYHINTRDNGTVTAGKWGITEDDADLLIMKMDARGEVLWSKHLAVNRRLDIYLLKEMSDGSIMFAGNSHVGPPPYNADLLLIKFTCQGDITWSRNITMDGSVISKRRLSLYSLNEGKNNDAIISFHNWELNVQYGVICRVDQLGTLLWSKTFYGLDPDTNVPTVCFYSDNKIFVFGFNTFYTNFFNYDKSFFAMKLNYDDGTVEDIKGINYSEFRTNRAVLVGHHMIHFYAEQLDNGKFVLYGEFSNFNTETYFYKLILDKNFSIHQTKTYATSPDLGVNWAKIRVFPNGQTHIISAVHNRQKLYWYASDSADNKIREKKIEYPDTYIELQYRVAQNGKDRSNYIVSLMTPSKSSIEIVQAEDGDPNINPCLGTDTSFVKQVAWQAISGGSKSWKAVKDNEAVLSPVSLVTSPVSTTTDYMCMSAMGPAPVVQTLKITGPDTVCSPNSTQTYTLRGKKHHQVVKWDIDNGRYDLLTKLTDSSISISFKKTLVTPQQVKLYATIADGCDLIRDSITIHLIPDNNKLPDSLVTCNFPVKLTPGNWYKSYLWHDGSSDSVFVASMIGRYHVQLGTFCGVTVSDSVVILSTIIKNHNLTVCERDSLIIRAATGYSNYQWSPLYNLEMLAGNSIRVYPEVDTFYIVKAATIDGCNITDTSFVKVIPRRSINLGVDTAICIGNTITLDAGANFSNYNWSTGDASRRLMVTTPGTYHIMAMDDKGCISKDTITIIENGCKNGVFVPTAFSPNNDGKNDLFKPKIWGSISEYEFSIYNRWGELIFRTDEPGRGWAGTYKGVQQNTGTFVWTLKYRLNDVSNVEKGIVTLIR